MKAFLTRITWVKIIHWALFAAMIAEILSGISLFYRKEIASFFPAFPGAFAYKIHISLVIPLIILLILHIFIIRWKRKKA